MDIQIILTISILILAGVVLYILGCCLHEKKNPSQARFEPKPLDEISTVVIGINTKSNNNQLVLPPPSYNEIMKNCADFNKAPPSYIESIEMSYYIDANL